MPGFKNRSKNVSPALKATAGNVNKVGSVSKAIVHTTEVLPVMDAGKVVAIFIYNGYAIKDLLELP